MLGRPMDTFGKGAVMVAANGGLLPKFSKYVGVAEWKNALFLWVNLSSDGDYPNEFLDGGKAITWFGGSRVDEDSNVVQRLIHSQSSLYPYHQCNHFQRSTNSYEEIKDKDEDDNNKDIVLLFVRHPGENYIPLGRVACIGWTLTARPVRITWALRDFERLNKASKETFSKIISFHSREQH